MQRTEARSDGIVVTIDGPAGSGKSSTARAVAAELGYRHLDSGALYRGITLAALRAEVPSERWNELTEEQLEAWDVRAAPDRQRYRVLIGGAEAGDALRAPEVNANVSRMAAVPAVREWLLGALREAGTRGGLVTDGRDMGTVVFPGAELKVFLVCAHQERARRRLAEQGTPDPSREDIRAEMDRLGSRDALDAGRAVAPLLRAPDAVLLDTTDLPFDAQVRAIVRLARDRETG